MLEGVANAQVEIELAPEGGGSPGRLGLKDPALPRRQGGVLRLQAQVEADQEEVEVEPGPNAAAESQLSGHRGDIESAARLGGVLLQFPNVADVHEQRPLQVADQLETVFRV